MNDNTRKLNSYVEIDDLIDDAVNNALVRRSEGLLPLSDKEAESILGGASPSLHGVILGVIIKPPFPIEDCTDPQPNPFPIVHGVIIKPNSAE